MEILKLNRRVFKLFGMCSLGEENGFLLKIGQIVSVFLIMMNFISLEWFSVLYLAEHYQSGDIDQNLFVLIQVIGTLPSIASFISLVYRMKSVCGYFDQIQNVFDKCNCRLNFVFFFSIRIIDSLYPQMKILRLA